LELRGNGDPDFGDMASPAEGVEVQRGIGHDPAVVFRQNGENPVIIEIAGPFLQQLAVGASLPSQRRFSSGRLIKKL
jgi:hypothetical protein